MAHNGGIEGTGVQGEEPLWTPLEDAVGYELAGWFMWMFEVRLADGRRVDAYKHITTRQYLHLAAGGSAFLYSSEGRYVSTRLASLIAIVFDGWHRDEPSPREVELLETAIAAARRGRPVEHLAQERHVRRAVGEPGDD